MWRKQSGCRKWSRSEKQKSKTKQRESSENIYSSEPVVCRAQFTSHGSKSREWGNRIPRFSSALTYMSELNFSLGKLCDQPMPFAVRLYKSKVYMSSAYFSYEQSCLLLFALSQNLHNEKISINPPSSFTSLLPHRWELKLLSLCFP